MVLYGQLVVGPPGSGKTTYCDGMQQYLRLLGRDSWVVNLDPANEIPRLLRQMDDTTKETTNDDIVKKKDEFERTLPYETILDVCEDMVCLSNVTSKLHLGPNGGLLFCMEYLERHVDELVTLLTKRIEDRISKTFPDVIPSTVWQRPSIATGTKLPYLIFDLPGQVELYTHCTCLSTMIEALTKKLDLRLVSVHLVDAHSCIDVGKFVSCALVSTTAMLRLELPAVNVLSKVDLLDGYNTNVGGDGHMPFNLDYFLECHELTRLVDHLDGERDVGGNDIKDYADDAKYQLARSKMRNKKFFQRNRKLHASLCEVVDDFGLLHYIPLNIMDVESVGRVLMRIDKSNGYVFAKDAENSVSKSKNGVASVGDMFNCAMCVEGNGGMDDMGRYISDVQERFLSSFFIENVEELQRKQGDKSII